MVPRNCELVHTAAFEFVYTPQKYAVAVINRWEFFLWLVVNLCALQGFVRTKMSTIPNVIRVRTILYQGTIFFLGGGRFYGGRPQILGSNSPITGPYFFTTWKLGSRLRSSESNPKQN